MLSDYSLFVTCMLKAPLHPVQALAPSEMDGRSRLHRDDMFSTWHTAITRQTSHTKPKTSCEYDRGPKNFLRAHVADSRATLFTLRADLASSTSLPRQEAAKAAALRHEGELPAPRSARHSAKSAVARAPTGAESLAPLHGQTACKRRPNRLEYHGA